MNWIAEEVVVVVLNQRSSVLYLERTGNDKTSISGENKLIGNGVLYVDN